MTPAWIKVSHREVRPGVQQVRLRFFSGEPMVSLVAAIYLLLSVLTGVAASDGIPKLFIFCAVFGMAAVATIAARIQRTEIAIDRDELRVRSGVLARFGRNRYKRSEIEGIALDSETLQLKFADRPPEAILSLDKVRVQDVAELVKNALEFPQSVRAAPPRPALSPPDPVAMMKRLGEPPPRVRARLGSSWFRPCLKISFQARVPLFDRAASRGTAMVVVTIGFLAFMLAQRFAPDIDTAKVLLPAIGLLFASLLPLTFGRMLLNRVQVQISARRVRLRHFPIPLPLPRSVSAKRVSSFVVHTRSDTDRELAAVLTNGKERRLVRGDYSSDLLQWLARTMGLRPQ